MVSEGVVCSSCGADWNHITSMQYRDGRAYHILAFECHTTVTNNETVSRSKRCLEGEIARLKGLVLSASDEGGVIS